MTMYARPWALVVRDGKNTTRRFSTQQAARKAARLLPYRWTLFYEPTREGGGSFIDGT